MSALRSGAVEVLAWLKGSGLARNRLKKTIDGIQLAPIFRFCQWRQLLINFVVSSLGKLDGSIFSIVPSLHIPLIALFILLNIAFPFSFR